jgi:predicted amidohydrolase YtcJ
VLVVKYPCRKDIDDVVGQTPVFLWRACWHIGVGNSKALELAGIGLSCTEFDITGGVVDLYDADEAREGNAGPSGVLRERACELVTAAMGAKEAKSMTKFIEEGLTLCSRVGLTSVQTNDEGSYLIYRQLQQTNRLPIRVFLTPNQAELTKLPVDGGIKGISPFRAASLAVTCEGERTMCTAETMLTMERLKIFGDGSLGAQTAALRDPTGTGQITGVLIQDSSTLSSLIGDASAEGYRLEIHAIGDAAAEQVISAIESFGTTLDRPVLTHCQVLGPDLIPRMANSGVIANVQPSFVPTDMRWVEDRLTAAQQEWSYAWKSLLGHGVHVAGGSDAPIESCSPFLGMFDAIHRRGRGADRGRIFRPAECLSFAEALWIYTKGSAFACHSEHILGSLESGYAADFVLIDEKVALEPDRLETLSPSMVFVGGNVAFDAASAVDQGSDHAPQITSAGPFIPGKGGMRMKFACKCRCSIQH